MNDALRLRARTARAAVASGALRGAVLHELLASISPIDRDAWVDELLGIEPPPPDVADLPRGAVPYLPCGVDEIAAMVRDAPVEPSDELVDLGAGLGRAIILAHLLSGARARGVEIQAPLVQRANALRAELALDAVSFVHANAAEIALDGSVFFLYAPCNGEMFRCVMSRIEDVARRRPIIVAAVGVECHDAPWLAPRPSTCASLALYDSCVPGVPRRR